MHFNPFTLLGGALTGTLPNPGIVEDQAGLAIAAQVFGRRGIRPDDVVAGTGITITRSLGSITIESTATTSGDSDQIVLPVTAFGTRIHPLLGLAGGDLSGTYPNPTIVPENANLTNAHRSFIPQAPAVPYFGSGAAGPTGSTTTAPVVTVDSQGRVVSLTPATISGTSPGGAAGGDLSGTYPNPTVVPENASLALAQRVFSPQSQIVSSYIGSGAQGPIGDGTHVAAVTTDDQGRIVTLTSVLITGAAPSGAAGGDLSGTYPNPTVVPENASLSNAQRAFLPKSSADIVAYFGGGAQGPVGDSTHVAAVTIDSQGRIVTLTSVAIAASAASAVDNWVSAHIYA